MSFSEHAGGSFFEPLKGKTATFLVEDRQTDLALAKVLSYLATAEGQPCVILDLDALYSSNAVAIFGRLRPRTGSIRVRVPSPSSKVEDEFPALFRDGAAAVVVVDTMNTLYHAMAFDDGAYRSRKLSFAVASLSFAARGSGTAAIFTMYRRDDLSRRGSGRAISSLSDVTVGVERSGPQLQFVCEKGTAWAEGRFSTRIP